MPDFPCASPVNTDIGIGSGTLDITVEERESVHVDVAPHNANDHHAREAAEATEVNFDGDTLILRTPEAGIGWLFKRLPSLRITVRVPVGSNVRAKSASADVTLRGRAGKVTITAASGSIHVAEAGEVNANSGSGDVKIVSSDGHVHANTASGDVEIDRASGEITARSASGDVRIGEARDSVSATTASGDVLVRQGLRGVYKIRTVSGEVSVGVAKGTGVWLDLSSTSGRTSSDLAVGDTPVAVSSPDLNLQVRTVSGDIEVVRSQA
ncbi:DUF4097 family beta strand repeat-containing protein [Phytomonospora sp. NPDC050363]|uniref:DUF4097 family beta strand repeat-containing protein n=1 Tax=Phytomonospora sp. NPDC050363 TaxID=3155642 RepID=UPI0033F6BED1